MGVSGGGDQVAASRTVCPPSELVEAARALLPRAWAGEDITEDLHDIYRQAAVDGDDEAECAARFVEVADASIRGDQTATRRTATMLVERAQQAGFPLWESRGRHYLARLHLADGEEAQGIEELVTAEVLTDEYADTSVILVGAINGIASTYMLLGLFEDSARLFARMESMLDAVHDPWALRALLYNRLLNDATWALALEQIGAADDARARLRAAHQRVVAHDDVIAGSSIEGDIQLLVLFTELMTGKVSIDAGRERLASIKVDHQPESESFAHFGVATLLAEAGRYAEALEEVQAGLDDLHPIEGERVNMALRWLSTRIAVQSEPDHAGLREAWSYATLMTDKVWELRKRRRDAVLDRLQIRRLRSEHELVQRVSLEDALTGLANRRRLDRERSELATLDGADWVAVVYLDLDDFKTVNDTLGHDLGDEVLRAIAGLLRGSVRDQDLVGRYGGDEFVIVARDCDQQAADRLGERMLSSVRAHDWRELHPSLQVTVSAGIAVTDAAYGQLFSAADDALYAAKQGGRDRAIVRSVGQITTPEFVG